jgi:hypothetical protein
VAIGDFPPQIAVPHLHEARSAALDVCRAIIGYITTVIQHLNSGSLGRNHIASPDPANCCVRNPLYGVSA